MALVIDKQRSGNNAIQGFAPNRIETAVTLDVSTSMAFCPSTTVSYQINGTGDTAVLQAGAVRIVPLTTTTIVFTELTVVEVMDD